MRPAPPRSLRCLALAVLLSLLAAGTVRAESDFAQAKLDAFVDAFIVVAGVVDRWQPRIEAAASEAQAQDLERQARGEMIDAIEAVDGITAAEYSAIAEAMDGDPTLSKRLADIYRVKSGN